MLSTIWSVTSQETDLHVYVEIVAGGRTEPVESIDSSIGGESVAATGHHNLQKRITSSRQENK